MKFAVIPVLCLCLALVNCTYFNKKPCMPATYKEGYNNFLHRHVHPGAPENTDSGAWTIFLKNNSFCNRPIQSFFPYRDMQRINDVCAPTGGKIHLNNLCISKGNFSFITLTVRNGSCLIEHIIRESKHIILACEEIEEICQPVHYQKNPQDFIPEDSDPDCSGARSASHSGIKAAHTVLLLLIFICSALL